MSTIDPNYAIPGFRATKPVETGFASCLECSLESDDRCWKAPCMPDSRPDKQYVIMKAIEPSEATK